MIGWVVQQQYITPRKTDTQQRTLVEVFSPCCMSKGSDSSHCVCLFLRRSNSQFQQVKFPWQGTGGITLYLHGRVTPVKVSEGTRRLCSIISETSCRWRKYMSNRQLVLRMDWTWQSWICVDNMSSCIPALWRGKQDFIYRIQQTGNFTFFLQSLPGDSRESTLPQNCWASFLKDTTCSKLPRHISRSLNLTAALSNKWTQTSSQWGGVVEPDAIGVTRSFQRWYWLISINK